MDGRAGLILATGMAIPSSALRQRGYVARLASCGMAAVAIGREGAAGPVAVPAYSVGLRASAEKQLAALDKPIRERVAAAIDALAETPRPSGAIAMQGAAGLLRIRVGSYRVIYTALMRLSSCIGCVSGVVRGPVAEGGG